MPEPIKIIGRTSSINVRKVLWTCDEIGTPYDLDGDWERDAAVRRRSDLLALNPNGQFPVLVDGSWILWESNTICRYLATEHGRTDLLPSVARDRALVEQWMDWQATELNSAWSYAFMALVRKSPQHNRQDDIDASVARWNAKMGILEQRLAQTGAFVAGPTFTLADVVIAVSVNRWRCTPTAKPGLPAVDAYLERLGARPGFVKYANSGQP